MEGQNRGPASRLQRPRQLLHKLVKHLKFLIYIDTESLKYPLTGFLNRLLLFLFRQEIQRLFYDFPEPRGGIYPVAPADFIGDGFGQLFRVGSSEFS